MKSYHFALGVQVGNLNTEVGNNYKVCAIKKKNLYRLRTHGDKNW